MSSSSSSASLRKHPTRTRHIILDRVHVAVYLVTGPTAHCLQYGVDDVLPRHLRRHLHRDGVLLALLCRVHQLLKMLDRVT